MAKTSPPSKIAPSSTADKYRFYASVLVFGVVCLFTLARLLPTPAPTNESLAVITQPVSVTSKLTPVAYTDIGEATRLKLVEAVARCAAYSAERRRQMNQHLEWLANPNAIPADLLPAFGADPTEKLIFGMATYTSIEWRLADRPADSCLLVIGQTLNGLLEQFGTERFAEFDA